MSYYGSCGKLIVLEIGAIPLEITAITPWMWDQALGSTHNGSHSFFDYTPAYGKLTFCQLIYRTGLSHLNFCPWRVKTIYQMWIICSHAPQSNFFQKSGFSKGAYHINVRFPRWWQFIWLMRTVYQKPEKGHIAISSLASLQRGEVTPPGKVSACQPLMPLSFPLQPGLLLLSPLSLP